MFSVLKSREKPKIWLLDLRDRCDRCAAQAYVRVVGKSESSLQFCAHHYNKAMDNAIGYDNMMKFALEIIDERDRLTEEQSSD